MLYWSCTVMVVQVQCFTIWRRHTWYFVNSSSCFNGEQITKNVCFNVKTFSVFVTPLVKGQGEYIEDKGVHTPMHTHTKPERFYFPMGDWWKKEVMTERNWEGLEIRERKKESFCCNLTLKMLYLSLSLFLSFDAVAVACELRGTALLAES